ncbi:metal ABC transporter solute-binding protein, Zn/Mn family [Methanolobus profundi]|uniref:Zinc transport system substrate-binding protein n=1 Tax=Methanolobus profundi TaxID=487685 RepID=A0A1I4QMW3_9EURY|nr:zinc ABC transporter substrate-binding protein [Methanolobus profundi]SFM41369.1 zinc transport system substrate-binding protein [Methanolobus profundi]
MNKNMMVLMLLLIAGIILTAGCVDESDPVDETSGTTGMVVAVSILPQAEFVEKITGDNIEVIVMVPPGSDPHSYEPTPGQLRDLSDAKMYAMVGSGITIEDVMIDKIADLNPDMMIIDCSEGITLREMEAHEHEEEEADEHEGEEEHDESGLDPHIWTSPDNVEIMVENIYEGLVELDPENASVYLENKDAYLAELDALDEQIRSTLSDNEGSSFMVYHPAWGYFADQYGLTEVPVEIEGKEPSVRDMQNVIDEANEKGIKVIFVQSGFSTVSAQAIANEIGGEVVEIDPLAKDYIDNLSKVAEAFEKGLA